MDRVKGEVRVTTKVPVKVRVRDKNYKTISRDCAQASELVVVQAIVVRN